MIQDMSREVPIIGVMEYRRDGHSVIEVNPTHCPMRNHRLGPNRVSLGWHTHYRLRMYTCWECHAIDPKTDSWCRDKPDGLPSDDS